MSLSVWLGLDIFGGGRGTCTGPSVWGQFSKRESEFSRGIFTKAIL